MNEEQQGQEEVDVTEVLRTIKQGQRGTSTDLKHICETIMEESPKLIEKTGESFEWTQMDKQRMMQESEGSFLDRLGSIDINIQQEVQCEIEFLKEQIEVQKNMLVEE